MFTEIQISRQLAILLYKPKVELPSWFIVPNIHEKKYAAFDVGFKLKPWLRHAMLSVVK